MKGKPAGVPHVFCRNCCFSCADALLNPSDKSSALVLLPTVGPRAANIPPARSTVAAFRTYDAAQTG